MVTLNLIGATDTYAAEPVVEFVADTGTDHSWTVDFNASSAQVGWTLLIDYSTVEPEGTVAYAISRTITQDDLDGDEFSFSEDAGSLSNGTYYVSLSYADEFDIPISAVAPATVIFSASDVTAPTLSSPVGTKTGTTTANVGATTDTAEGELFVCATTTITTPTHDQIAAGQDSASVVAAAADSTPVSSTGAKLIALTGLQPGTGYYGHTTHIDVAGNKSTPVTSAIFTTDALTGTLSLPTAAAAASPDGDDTLTGTVTTNTASGNIYVVASTSSSAPTGVQIFAGQMHTGSAAAGANNIPITATGAHTLTVAGLTDSTRYWLHYVQKTGSNYSNVVTANAYTDVVDTFLEKQSTADTATIVGASNKTTFADVDTGNAHPNKKLLVLCGHNGNSTRLTGFNGTGLTFTKLYSFSTEYDTNNANSIAAFVADIPSGGTVAGLEVLNDSTADPVRVHASFYVMDRSATPTDLIVAFSASANELSDTLHVASYGAAFGIATTTTTTSGTNVCDWTGLPQENCDYNVSATWHVSTARYTNASASDLLNRTMTSNWLTDPSGNVRMAVVSFGDHI